MWRIVSSVILPAPFIFFKYLKYYKLAPLCCKQNKTSTSVRVSLGQLSLGWSTLMGKCLEVVQTFGSLGFKLPSVEDSQKPQVVRMFMGFFLFYFSIFIWVFLQRLTMSTTGVRVLKKKTHKNNTANILGRGQGRRLSWIILHTALTNPSLLPTV